MENHTTYTCYHYFDSHLDCSGTNVPNTGVHFGLDRQVENQEGYFRINSIEHGDPNLTGFWLGLSNMPFYKVIK